MNFKVRSADWDTDRDAIREIRERVFVIEQQVDPELEWDGLDAECEHAIVELEDGRIVGTGRLYCDQQGAKIGRMAVLRESRGRGIGAGILDFLVERARGRGIGTARLNAQTHALAFYERAGFRAEGPEFDEAGIPHRRMSMELQVNDEPEAFSSDQTTVLERRVLTAVDEILEGAIEIAGCARKELAIFSHELASPVFKDSRFLECVRRLATSGPHARGRVIVSHPGAAARNAGQFLALIRQLSSHLAIRGVAPQHRDRKVTFIIADDRGLIYHPAEDASETLLEYIPGTAKHYLNQFEEIWEHGNAHPDLRQIKI